MRNDCFKQGIGILIGFCILMLLLIGNAFSIAKAEKTKDALYNNTGKETVKVNDIPAGLK